MARSIFAIKKFFFQLGKFSLYLGYIFGLNIPNEASRLYTIWDSISSYFEQIVTNKKWNFSYHFSLINTRENAKIFSSRHTIQSNFSNLKNTQNYKIHSKGLISESENRFWIFLWSNKPWECWLCKCRWMQGLGTFKHLGKTESCAELMDLFFADQLW